MTTLKDLKVVLEGFDESLDVKFKMIPTPIDASVDGYEAGAITATQKTYIEIAYYYPLISKHDRKEREKTGQNQQRSQSR